MRTAAPLSVEVSIRERKVRAQVWRADVGRVRSIPAGHKHSRQRGNRSVGHRASLRRRSRNAHRPGDAVGHRRRPAAAKTWNSTRSVFHLNEGHSAFLTLELARELIQSQGLSFAEAAEAG